MALNDADKLEISRAKFINKLNSVETWDEFKILVGNLTKPQIVAAIKNAIQAEIIERTAIVASEDSRMTDLTEFDGELDTI